MNQDDFRRLLSAPRTDAAPAPAVAPKQAAAAAPAKAAGQDRKREHSKPFQKHRPAEREDKPASHGSHTAFRDRALERRAGSNKALEEEEELVQRVDYERSKFLGGDLSHTHLVKGLDWALLQKIRGSEGGEGAPAATAASAAPASGPASQPTEERPFSTAAGARIVAAAGAADRIYSLTEGVDDSAWAAPSTGTKPAPRYRGFTFSLGYEPDALADGIDPVVLAAGVDEEQLVLRPLETDETWEGAGGGSTLIDAIPVAFLQRLAALLAPPTGPSTTAAAAAASQIAAAYQSSSSVSSPGPVVHPQAAAAEPPLAGPGRPPLPAPSPAAPTAVRIVDDDDDDDIFSGVGRYTIADALGSVSSSAAAVPAPADVAAVASGARGATPPGSPPRLASAQMEDGEDSMQQTEAVGAVAAVASSPPSGQGLVGYDDDDDEVEEDEGARSAPAPAPAPASRPAVLAALAALPPRQLGGAATGKKNSVLDTLRAEARAKLGLPAAGPPVPATKPAAPAAAAALSGSAVQAGIAALSRVTGGASSSSAASSLRRPDLSSDEDDDASLFSRARARGLEGGIKSKDELISYGAGNEIKEREAGQGAVAAGEEGFAGMRAAGAKRPREAGKEGGGDRVAGRPRVGDAPAATVADDLAALRSGKFDALGGAVAAAPVRAAGGGQHPRAVSAPSAAASSSASWLERLAEDNEEDDKKTREAKRRAKQDSEFSKISKIIEDRRAGKVSGSLSFAGGGPEETGAAQ